MSQTLVQAEKPIKCTLTRIENEFGFLEPNQNVYKNILKDYVYIPEKKIIA